MVGERSRNLHGEELVRYLPQAFRDAYEALCVESLNDGMPQLGHQAARSAELGRAAGNPVGQARVNSSQVTSMGRKTGGPEKVLGKTSKTMKNEVAFRFKQKVDKRLRGLAREILSLLDGNRDTIVRMAATRICTGRCKKIGEYSWSFCPSCGGPMRDPDPPNGARVEKSRNHRQTGHVKPGV